MPVDRNVVPHSQVERQARIDLPIVLEISGMVTVADIADEHRQCDTVRASRGPENRLAKAWPVPVEIRRQRRLRAGKLVYGRCSRQIDGIGGCLQAPEVPAHLELVRATDPAQSLG